MTLLDRHTAALCERAASASSDSVTGAVRHSGQRSFRSSLVPATAVNSHDGLSAVASSRAYGPTIKRRLMESTMR